MRMSDDMAAYITMSCMLLLVLCSFCYMLSDQHTVSMHALTEGCLLYSVLTTDPYADDPELLCIYRVLVLMHAC